MPQPFQLELLVDFIDDAIKAAQPIGPEQVPGLIERFHNIGVTRLHWIYYGEAHGGWILPRKDEGLPNLALHRYRETIDRIGNPLSLAVETGHRLGMEVFGYFKPYEQGLSMMFPEGSPAAKEFGQLPILGGSIPGMDPFVASHPHLRARRRMDDLPRDIQSIPIHSLRLIKSDNAPTRIDKYNLQIWASDNNWQYELLDVPFEFHESIEPCPHDVRDIHETLVTRRGQGRRVLTLSGLNLRQKYVLLTTRFTEGKSDFYNAGLHLLEALDEHGRVIPGVFSNTNSYIYDAFTRDFRNHGLAFDNGIGDRAVWFDVPNTSGNQGFIAFCRGRNEYLPAGLCETCPDVTDYWLSEVDEILATGVDGIDFRVENHCMHTDHPDEYGFNDEVLALCPGGKAAPAHEVAEVRGKAYTDFLRRAKAKIAARGKIMRLHVDADWWRPDRPRVRGIAFPLNIDFTWRQWFDEGFPQEATLRLFQLPFDTIYNDPLVAEMIERCQRGGVPIYVPRFVNAGVDAFLAELKRTRDDGRFAGAQIYEAASIYRFNENGHWQVKDGMQKLLDGIQSLA